MYPHTGFCSQYYMNHQSESVEIFGMMTYIYRRLLAITKLKITHEILNKLNSDV